MRWRVAVKSIEGHERLLRDVLQRFDVAIVEEQGERRIVSPMFDAEKTPQDVRKLAQRICGSIDKATSDQAQIRLKVDLGNVYELKPDGSLGEHVFVDVDLASLTITGHAAFMGVTEAVGLSDEDRQRIATEKQEREYQDGLRVALSRCLSLYRDNRALRIQQLLQGELDTLDMWHIFEILKPDIAAIASEKQVIRFKRSINHPAAFGTESRHAVSSDEPPPNPMSPDEARGFIQDVATRWMNRIAGV
jgi:hypothetical protein